LVDKHRSSEPPLLPADHGQKRFSAGCLSPVCAGELTPSSTMRKPELRLSDDLE
jgi:hypothetical protein